MPKCETSQTFRAKPFFSVKTVKIVRLFIWKKQKQSAQKIDARAVYMKWKTLFRPSGCIVPSLKMISISNCFCLKLVPEHLLRPLTAMSDRLWPGELKCSAIGQPPVFFGTLRRCSPNRSRRVRPVSSMYIAGGIDGTRCSTQRSLIYR